METIVSKKILPIIALLLAALISFFLISGYASSAEFHQNTLAALEEKQTTVLELSAASAAASAAITLIPGDAATPIADKLADLSSHFLLVLCAIFLEKYLLTITGTVTFSLLIPVSCLLCILYILFGWKSLCQIAAKLTIFGFLIVLVIPSSVYLSDMIEDTYQSSIEETLETAKETTAEIESTANSEETEDQGFWAGIISSVTNGVSNVIADITDRAGAMVNNFLEALAVMLVTCCAIPILVLLSFVWFAKVLLSVDLPISYSGIHRGLTGKIFTKRQKVSQ